MPKLVIGMGIPGAGKSTILKAFADEYGYEYVSVDDVRKSHGLKVEQPSTEREWDEIRSRTIESYRTGKTVVVDGTFLGDVRKRFIDYVRAHGVGKIQGILVATPAEVAWERNSSREQKTTREVFDDRLQHLKDFPPAMIDGFDALFTLDENGNLREVEIPRDGRREHTRERRFI